jgi:hypothetical protein
MGVANVPAAAGGGIKLVQRGEAVSAGNTTITAVNTAKTFVRSFSTGATGTIQTDSASNGTLSPSGGAISGTGHTGSPDTAAINAGGSFATYSGTRTLSGGTTNATTKQFGVYLTDATTLAATGACRWEVVEFA